MHKSTFNSLHILNSNLTQLSFRDSYSKNDIIIDTTALTPLFIIAILKTQASIQATSPILFSITVDSIQRALFIPKQTKCE